MNKIKNVLVTGTGLQKQSFCTTKLRFVSKAKLWYAKASQCQKVLSGKQSVTGCKSEAFAYQSKALVTPVPITRRYMITGAKRISNYWWAFIVSFGGLAFFITGFASFLQRGIFLFNQSKSISFFPQGLIMCFYGCLGLLFGFYLWCTIFWKVGDGFNEFNQNQGLVRIFRWGLPGKNRRIDFQYQMNEIEGVRVELKEGINPRRMISLKMKASSKRVSYKNSVFATPAVKKKQATLDSTFSNQSSGQNTIEELRKTALKSKLSNEKKSQRNAFIVPLTRVGQPISLEKIESQASELAQFLRVSLETAYLDS